MFLNRVLNDSVYLSKSELAQLVSDLYMEFDPSMKYEGNRSAMNEFGLIAWFLRNKTYAPMSLIQSVMAIGGVSKQGYGASAVVSNFEDSCLEKPCSLCGSNYDQLQLMISLADKFYNLSKNPFLDRMDDEAEDVALYLASLEFGAYDSRKRQGGGKQFFKPTPLEPSAVSLHELLVRSANGTPLATLLEDYTVTLNS